MVKQAKEPTKKVRIKFMKKGEGVQYSTQGLHVAQEHRSLLPQKEINDYRSRHRNSVPGHKIEPGETYELPADVAIHYLKSSPNFLEEVYE